MVSIIKKGFLLLYFLTLAVFPTMAECREVTGPEIELIAEVIKTSALPDPSGAAYPNCLTLIKYKVVKVINGQFLADEALVAMWGFRNFKLSEPGTYQVGDKVKLKIVRFSELGNELSEIMRVDDTGDYDSELYWAHNSELIQRNTPKDKPANTTYKKSNKAKSNVSVVDKILKVLAAHGNDVIGSHDSKQLFGNYQYLVNERFWDSPSEKDETLTIGILDAILEFSNYLKSKDIQLVTIFPPAAVAIYPEIATNVNYSFERDGRIDKTFLEFQKELQKNGILCVDILPIFMGQKWIKWSDGNLYPLYFQNDVHWSGFAASLAGKAVAKAVKNSDWFSKIAHDYPPMEVNFEDGYSLETRVIGSYSKRIPDWDLPAPKNLRRSKFPTKSFVLTDHDTNAPVWILGDSFSLFGEFYQDISANLGLPYNVIASGGGSPNAVREEFARIKDTSKIKIVIWEISYPFLDNDSLWKQISFKH
jgi:hypothetical protein